MIKTLRVALAFLALAATAAAPGAEKTANQGVATLQAPARPRPQVPQFPADVKARGDRLWNAASPAVKSWANQNVPGIAGGTAPPESLARAAAQTRWPNLQAAGAYDALTFLATYEAAKTEQTEIGKLDSLSEMSSMQSMRLQMAMDRMSKMMTTLSNLLKKISDTADGIVGNLK
jgi:hypothetical protein